MTVVYIEFIIVILGLMATLVLFFHLPILPGIEADGRKIRTARDIHDGRMIFASRNMNGGRKIHASRDIHDGRNMPAVSIVIPARNEERNLSLLLADLEAQTFAALEIICVDDASDDATAQIALTHGARLVSLTDKPEGWTGKTWACQKGAEAAGGQLLLFLDADVRLGKDGVRKLVQAFLREGCAVSVQPYHRTERIYEQLSMLFNLVQIAANGTALPKPLDVGLFGPVIVMERADYLMAGGHESVKNSLAEDVALGLQLKKAGMPYRLFIGEADIAYRMYSGGLRSLLQGWIKNLAAGAAGTPLPVFLLIFFWIASLTSVPLQLVKFAILANLPWLTVYSFLYLLWAVILVILTRQVGRFQPWAFAGYPLLVLVLLGVFSVSMIKKPLA